MIFPKISELMYGGDYIVLPEIKEGLRLSSWMWVLELEFHCFLGFSLIVDFLSSFTVKSSYKKKTITS